MILYYATLSSHLTELRNLVEIYYYEFLVEVDLVGMYFFIISSIVVLN
jgi:hypothetical protein